MDENDQYELLYVSEERQKKNIQDTNYFGQSKRNLLFFLLCCFTSILLIAGTMKIVFKTKTLTNQNPSLQNQLVHHEEMINNPPKIDILQKHEVDDFIKQQAQQQNIPEEYILAYLLLKKSETLPQRMEYSYYEYLYNISKFPELPFCIIAPSRNNMVDNRQERFLNSVNQQNYSSFRLIYVDDNSDDGTVQFTKKYLQTHEKLKNKVIIVEQQQRKYSLYNKNKAIFEFCKHGEIIIDADADDAFIGTEVFHVVNAFYQANKDLWYIYANYLTNNKEGKIEKGLSDFLKWEPGYSYRLSDSWVTSHLKTFRRELYLKIHQTDFLKEDGSTYKWASDRFIHYSLAELAGQKHSNHFNAFLYFYDQFTNPMRNFDVIRPDKIKSQMVRPYSSLDDLQATPKRVTNFKLPKLTEEKYRRAKVKYEDLLKRQEIFGVKIVD